MINVNDRVSVELTPDGQRVWFKHFEGFPNLQDQAKTVTAARYELKVELWRLMEVFGPHIRMGGPQHFINNRVEFENSLHERLSFGAYQQAAERTANRKDVDTVEKRLANFALGLAGESGEACDLVKKHLFHGHHLDRDKIKKELGDVLWYIATMAHTLGMRLEDVAQANVDKLRARYPEGFSAERSVNREERAERAESETLPDPKEAPTMTRLKTAPPGESA
jgi:NTP pyrophosphatase (non-canonical NTP hydrolase)